MRRTQFTPNAECQCFVSQFLDSSTVKKKFIMGMAVEGHALDVCKLIDIDGFADDYSSNSTFAGKPVLRSDEIPKDSLVLVCSSVRPVSAVRNLKAKGFESVCDYASFYMHVKDKSLAILILDTFAEEYEKNRARFDWIRGELKDHESQRVFDTLIEYRLTADLTLMESFSFLPSEQYFPDFITLDREVFIDAGGYDGATTVEFVKRCPNYRTVYLFEPSPTNMEQARRKLSGFRDVHCINAGLSDSPGELRFSNQGSSSSFTEEGEIFARINALDNMVVERITFLKQDVYEPAESKVIEGARNHIMRDHPKLAIVVYHKPNELWTIPCQVLSIRQDYDLYLRHYTEGIYETVMYFVPKAG